jgi:hypothetical protein
LSEAKGKGTLMQSQIPRGVVTTIFPDRKIVVTPRLYDSISI